jgi:hypothetical protein
METHKIKWNASTREAWLDGKKLDPKRSQELRNHSPDGFNCGYSGSGCCQLALAILLELTDEKMALRRYYDFRWQFVAVWPRESFEIEFQYHKK